MREMLRVRPAALAAAGPALHAEAATLAGLTRRLAAGLDELGVELAVALAAGGALTGGEGWLPVAAGRSSAAAARLAEAVRRSGGGLAAALDDLATGLRLTARRYVDADDLVVALAGLAGPTAAPGR